MTALRELRRAADLSQQEFAALIEVPLNTFRMWDSGLRLIPPHVLRRAQTAATAHIRNAEQLSLDHLAREFGLHERRLRAAARTGRLQVTFSSRSTFRRPIRLATRVAVQAFIRKDYRRFGGQSPAVAPLPSVPRDYDAHLKRWTEPASELRHVLSLEHGVEAAGKLALAVANQKPNRLLPLNESPSDLPVCCLTHASSG